MTAFFDTSAIVPLILREPHSQAARTAWETAEECFAWKWLKVETEAALVRRKASAPAWQLWRTIEASISWGEPEGDWIEPLKTFNRGVGLRAADAGHLFVMEHCAAGLENLVLVTFDSEMTKAAQQRGSHSSRIRRSGLLGFSGFSARHLARRHHLLRRAEGKFEAPFLQDV